MKHYVSYLDVLKYVAIVVSIIISLAVFSFVFSFLRNGYQVNTGGASAPFILLMFPAVIGELFFLYFSPRLFSRRFSEGRLMKAFLRVNGVFCLGFGLVVLIQMLMYRSLFEVDSDMLLALLGEHNDMISYLTMGVGMALIVASLLVGPRRRSSD